MRSCEIIGRRVSIHQELLKNGLRRRGALGDKGQFQVLDDPIDNGVLHEEGDDAHRASAAGTAHGVDLIDLPDHRRPAFGGDAPLLFLDNAQRSGREARLATLPR
jgi:hypothetical protein